MTKEALDHIANGGKMIEQPAPTNCRHCGGPDNVLCAGQCKNQPAQQQPVPWSQALEDVWAIALHLEDVSAEQPAQQEPVLQDIEQYRLQMAGISTAAIGYWKESDGIHPDYDTIALRDVAKLYAKYDELYRAQRTWVGLLWGNLPEDGQNHDFLRGAVWAEAKLKELNT